MFFLEACFFFFFLTEGYPNRQLLKANQATKRLKVKSLIVTGFNYSFKLFKKWKKNKSLFFQLLSSRSKQPKKIPQMPQNQIQKKDLFRKVCLEKSNISLSEMMINIEFKVWDCVDYIYKILSNFTAIIIPVPGKKHT